VLAYLLISFDIAFEHLNFANQTGVT